jgi:hypothetical protein
MATYQIERRKRGVIGWIFLVLFWLFNVFMLISVIGGLANVSSSYDTMTSTAERAGASIGTALGLSMLMGVWLTGAVILGLCALLTQGPKIIETVTDGVSNSGDGDVATSAPRRKHNPLLIWGGAAVAAFVFLILIGTIFGNASNAPNSDPSPQAIAESAAVATPTATAPEPNWQYTSEQDEMRGATNRFAISQSTNVANMGFPYETVRMSITLRDHAQHGRDIMLAVNEGQFVCRYRGCSISAKFDDGEIQTFSVNEAEAGSNDVLFIQNQSRFLAALRTAQRVTIEAQFYNRGGEQFAFNVAGLEWE